MRDIAIKLGRDRKLIGIVSMPECKAVNHAVLLVNAGLIHRVGPNRLYVSYGRRLAGLGVMACRFDIAGLGDSLAVANPRGDFRTEAAYQIGEVMDSLSKEYGASSFAVLGICSGGELAAEIAARDRRVRAAVIVNAGLLDDDAYYERINEFRRRNVRRLHLRKLRNLASWRRLLSGKSRLWSQLGKVFEGLPRAHHAKDAVVVPEDVAVAENIGSYDRRGAGYGGVDWSAICASGCRVLVVHAELSVNLDVYRAGARAPASHLIEERVLPRIDHGFTALSSHEELFEAVVSTLLHTHGEGSAAASSQRLAGRMGSKR